MDLGDAVEACEFVHVFAGGNISREEDEVVPLCFKGVWVAAGNH